MTELTDSGPTVGVAPPEQPVEPAGTPVGGGTPATAPRPAASLRRTILHVGAAGVGVLALVLLIRGVGVHAFLTLVRALAWWLPVLFALEAGRLGTEIAQTYTMTAAVRTRVPFLELLRIHVIAFGVSLVVPAGRATAEATRAALLSPFVGTAEAAAIAWCNQSMAMLGGALIALPCLAATIYLTGFSAITITLFGFTCVAVSVVAALQVGARHKELGGAIGRRFARFASAASAFQDASRSLPLFPPGPVLASFTSRILQALEYTVLLYALGKRHGVLESLLAQGVNLLGGAVGDLIPGQVGATDSAFALASSTLGITAADGVAITVMIHFVQVLWALIGLSTPLWWRGAPPKPQRAE